MFLVCFKIVRAWEKTLDKTLETVDNSRPYVMLCYVLVRKVYVDAELTRGKTGKKAQKGEG